jgi:hypothetical protein
MHRLVPHASAEDGAGARRSRRRPASVSGHHADSRPVDLDQRVRFECFHDRRQLTLNKRDEVTSAKIPRPNQQQLVRPLIQEMRVVSSFR